MTSAITLDRRSAAIFYSDVVGYSRLMGADEIGTIGALRNAFSAIVEPAIRAADGRLVQIAGDAVLAEFSAAASAVDCALAIQRGLAERNADVDPERRIQFRIGVNYGEIVGHGESIFGDTVNIAARIEGIAEPGGLAISRRVYDAIAERDDLAFESMGERRLKNILKPVEVFRLATGRPMQMAEPPALTLPQRPSIAILPFENRTGDPEQQYFAEGLAESIIIDLSRFRALFVIARNASFVYSSGHSDLTEVGRQLGVRYVLTGSLWQSGERLRLNLRLSEAESGLMLWTSRREFDRADLFRTQDELTRDIVSALPGRIEAHWLEGSRRKRAENFVAYDYTLKAWDLLYTHGGEQHAAIRSLCQQAIFLQPGYAQAQAMLGYSWMLTWFRNQDPSALDAADREAKRALLLDPMDGWCQFVAGYVSLYHHRYDEAEEHYNRAIELNPNDAHLLSEMGALKKYLGETEEAMDWIRQGMRLSPTRNAWMWHEMGLALVTARRPGEALECFAKVQPPLPFDDIYVSICQAKLGKTSEAKALARRVLMSRPEITVRGWATREPYYNKPDLEDFLDGMRIAGFPEE
ncbi:MAG TPA: tetratricopeptide repeat protein [Candidatus Binatia bacterium]|nr:tetratricopeptide repeat protein [Candidatus Binatia bacterium]